MTDTHPIRTRVIATLLSASLLGAASYVWPAFRRFLISTAKTAVELLAFPVPFSLPAWVLLLGVALVAFGAVGAIRLSRALFPLWKAYTSDSFFGIRWRWGYHAGGMTRPMAYCPTDDTLLVVAPSMSYHIKFHCETCDRLFPCETHFGDLSDLQEKVMRQVDRLIRSGEWQKRPQDRA